MPFERWVRIVRREGLGLPAALIREAAQRAWMMGWVRASLRPVFGKPEPRGWIFLVGCYGSGTTFLREILGAHPEVTTLPREGVRFTDVLRRPEELGWTRMWAECEAAMALPPKPDPGSVARLRADWAPWIDRERDLLEKSVSNLTRLDWLAMNFPGARFVGIVRNGYCVTEGILRRARPQGAARREVGDRYPLEMAAGQWVLANRRLLGCPELAPRLHVLSYEALVRDSVDTLNRIWSFLELSPVTTIRTDGALRVGSREFGVFDGNPGSFRRLSPEDLDAMTTHLAPMLDRLGYPSWKPKSHGAGQGGPHDGYDASRVPDKVGADG